MTPNPIPGTVTDPAAAPAVRHSAHPDHEQGLYLQPLPECLAPTEADRAARPDLPMPHPGAMVVLDGGHVMWLEPRSRAPHLTRESVLLWGAPMLGRNGCEGAEWDNLVPCDPDDIGLDQDISQALTTTQELLVEHANATPDEADDAPVTADAPEAPTAPRGTAKIGV